MQSQPANQNSSAYHCPLCQTPLVSELGTHGERVIHTQSDAVSLIASNWAELPPHIRETIMTILQCATPVKKTTED